jgi:predicted nucleotidyltransferase
MQNENPQILTIKPLLRNKLTQVSEICRKHKVVKLFVFGSVCTNKFTKNSDIDFLVGFESPYFDGYADNLFDLEEQLENLLNRKVDIVSLATLSNPYFIKVVEKTKILIYD